MALPRCWSAALFAVALGAAWWRSPQPAAPVFATPAPASAGQQAPLLLSHPLTASGGVVGAPALTQLPDGRIAAAWAVGEAAIHFSIHERDGWRQPRLIATPESAAGGLFAHIRGVGQPRLYAEGSWLHLWFAASGLGGEANVLLAHSVSTDGGGAWSRPERLPASPLAGYGVTLGGPPAPLSDGGLALPLRQTLFAAPGAWLRLNANGRSVDMTRLPHSLPIPDPAVAPLDASRALTLPPAVLRLSGGRLLLAANPAARRGALELWLAAGAGGGWKLARRIEAAADPADFSPPALLQGRDGNIHLAYARGRDIRYLVFNEAWLLAGDGP